MHKIIIIILIIFFIHEHILSMWLMHFLHSSQANMLEGEGKTPILNLLELEEIGYKIVAYPLSLLGVSIQAMQVMNRNLILFCKENNLT